MFPAPPVRLLSVLSFVLCVGTLSLSTTAIAAPVASHADGGASRAAKDKRLQTALLDYQQDNFPVALREFAAEAKRGNRIAQFDYAMMLLNGEGTPANVDEALIWLRKSAVAGMSHAQYTYGRLYDDAQVVPRDLKLAHYWFTKAAKQGHTQAQIALATQFMDGRGTPRNFGEAFKWYLRAAKSGDQASEYIVASFYERGGDGVKVDLTSARLWYALAAAQGDPAAAGKYAEVTARLKKSAPAPSGKARPGVTLDLDPEPPAAAPPQNPTPFQKGVPL